MRISEKLPEAAGENQMGKTKRRRATPEKKKWNGRTVPVLLYIALFIFCTLAAMVNSVPERHEFAAGKLCEETVTAPRDIVDEAATQRLQQEAMQKVQPVYARNEDIWGEVETGLETAFSQLEAVRTAAKNTYIQYASLAGDADINAQKVNWQTVLTGVNMTNLLELAPSYITEEEIYTIAALSQDKLISLREALIERVRTQMERGITDDDVEELAETVRSGLVSGGLFTAAQAQLAETLVVNIVKGNLVYDIEATEAAKQAAAENIVPVEYKKGQNIVRQGEIISEEQYALIKQLGLTSDQTSMLPRWTVGILLMGLTFGAAFLYAGVADRSLLDSAKTATSVCLLTAAGVVLALICKRIDIRFNLVFLPAILGAVFLRRRTALAFGVFNSIIISFIMAPVSEFVFDGQVLRMLLSSILGTAAGILVLRKKQHRGEYVLAGTVAGFASAVVYLCYAIMEAASVQKCLMAMGFGMAGGMVSGLLSVGVLPILESVFSLATPSKLLELSSPGNPLLKRLMIEAPGTYHHSIMTANLAEAAADAVGGDALLARVASYYHDIGKLASPVMFKENQMHIGNPHDELDPKESAGIIISHVKNGVALADRYKLPQRMRDIIAQHHGDSLAGYFYYKAKQNGEAEEADFRYPGPKPQTKEAGIVMLADVVEAAIRANGTKGLENVREQIDKLIKAKFEDGQLDDCPLNRRDLKRIAAAFLYIFEGANHERIIYPEDEE